MLTVPVPSLPPSNKPNPNQISVNSAKAGVVNGAGAPGQTPGAGRACESCYSKSRRRPASASRDAPAEPSGEPRAGTAACGGRAAPWCPLPSPVLLKNPSISNFVVRSRPVLPVVFLGSPYHAVSPLRVLLDVLEEIWWLENANPPRRREARPKPQ